EAPARDPATRPAPRRLCGAATRDAGADDRESVRPEGGDVAHAPVDHDSADAARYGCRREHFAPVSELGLDTDIDSERTAGGSAGHRHVQGEGVRRGAA